MSLSCATTDESQDNKQIFTSFKEAKKTISILQSSWRFSFYSPIHLLFNPRLDVDLAIQIVDAYVFRFAMTQSPVGLSMLHPGQTFKLELS